MKCPQCGKDIELKPKPGEPGRVVGHCVCNPAGPVIITNAPKPKRRKKEEITNGNT